jgi:hypothetical protein
MIAERGNGGKPQAANGAFLCLFAGVVMAYGWGYRGVVGHEAGAMVPGALLGLAVCLGSGRADWHRRSAVAGLFGAVGWAWGGSLSYMEQTMYTISDVLPDVLFGYAMLFFLGGLWAGIGGAVLGLAFTLPRSRLQRLVGPFVAISVAFLAVYLYLLISPNVRERYERFTAEYFNDADWLAALIVIVVGSLYWVVRPQERAEAGLFVTGGSAWWIGYLALTKFGGLSLGPPYRSEGWGGVLGILVVLIVYLVRQRNMAALMVCLYGIVGGGIGFALAVFVRHPIRVSWGPFAAWGGTMQWKIAEESFGFFMGIAIALGVRRLARGGLAPALEDVPRRPLDVFAGFVLLVAILWMNLRRAPMAWIGRYHAVPDSPTAGLMPWAWFALGGFVLTALVLYALYLYWRRELSIAPASAYGKGAFVFILLMWVTVIGAFVQSFPGAQSEKFPLVDASFIVLASIATAMVLSRRSVRSPSSPAHVAGVMPSDLCWRVGKGYGLVWLSVPVILLAISGLSMAMQDGPVAGARKRFGPDAYWRQITQIVAKWELVGLADKIGGTPNTLPKEAPLVLDIQQDRTVVASQSDGTLLPDAHTWYHKDSVVWLDWYGRKPDNPERVSIQMTLKGEALYIAWPPNGAPKGYLVYRKAGGR